MKSENAAIFLLLQLLSWFALLLLCSCALCGFACLGCGGLCCCWLSFPSDDCDKKKGQAVGLVLSSWVVGLLFVCYMFSAAFIASSFDFEKTHPAPQVRCALNLPPRFFKVSLIARVSPITAIAFSE